MLARWSPPSKANCRTHKPDSDCVERTRRTFGRNMRTADLIEPGASASDGGADRPAAPRNPRELFLLFRHYDREAKLEGLLDGIDFAGVDPLQV
jgi:hypothetical protein